MSEIYSVSRFFIYFLFFIYSSAIIIKAQETFTIIINVENLYINI